MFAAGNATASFADAARPFALLIGITTAPKKA
jgi:hypothetical protein